MHAQSHYDVAEMGLDPSEVWSQNLFCKHLFPVLAKWEEKSSLRWNLTGGHRPDFEVLCWYVKSCVSNLWNLECH